MKHTATSRWFRKVGLHVAGGEGGEGDYNFPTDETRSSCHPSNALDPVASVAAVNNWQSFIPTSFSILLQKHSDSHRRLQAVIFRSSHVRFQHRHFDNANEPMQQILLGSDRRAGFHIETGDV